jgi:hypothetical protein
LFPAPISRTMHLIVTGGGHYRDKLRVSGVGQDLFRMFNPNFAHIFH